MCDNRNDDDDLFVKGNPDWFGSDVASLVIILLIIVGLLFIF